MNSYTYCLVPCFLCPYNTTVWSPSAHNTYLPTFQSSCLVSKVHPPLRSNLDKKVILAEKDYACKETISELQFTLRSRTHCHHYYSLTLFWDCCCYCAKLIYHSGKLSFNYCCCAWRFHYSESLYLYSLNDHLPSLFRYNHSDTADTPFH